jgi:hypothetical protein
MPQSSIAVAADFAEAMLTARRAKNWLVALVFLMILLQIVLFFLVRFDVIALAPMTPATADTAPIIVTATRPATSVAVPVPEAPAAADVSTGQKMIQYVVGLTAFLGVILIIVLDVILLLIINIMLLGRLIGISRVMSAFIWCVLLTALLFPWQAFLNSQGLTEAEAPFKIPGVLYTWYELRAAKDQFASPDSNLLVLKWSRFVVFPLLAAGLLLAVHVKSKRGLRAALGESDHAGGEELPDDHPL